MKNLVQVAVIPAVKEGERLAFYINVGSLPAHKIPTYIEGIKVSLNKNRVYPVHEEYFIPVLNGVPSIELKIVQAISANDVISIKG